MKGGILVVVLIALLAGGIAYALRSPDLEGLQAKHASARDILTDLEKDMTEWSTEAQKFEDEMKSVFSRFKRTGTKNRSLNPAYRLAKAPEEIANMEGLLTDYIRGMEEDIAAWAEHGDLLSIELSRLEKLRERSRDGLGEFLRRKIAVMTAERDDIDALLPEALRDLEKAREVLGR